MSIEKCEKDRLSHYDHDDDYISCCACDLTKHIDNMHVTPLGDMCTECIEDSEAEEECHSCRGSGEGYTDGSTCSKCKGHGILGSRNINDYGRV